MPFARLGVFAILWIGTIGEHDRVRDLPLGATGDDDRLELQPLRAMHRPESHLASFAVGFLRKVVRRNALRDETLLEVVEDAFGATENRDATRLQAATDPCPYGLRDRVVLF